MINYIEGDLFAGVDTLVHYGHRSHVVIPHIVNNQGAWGGFVVPLGKKYPNVQEGYQRDIQCGLKLGETKYFAGQHGEVTVANMCAQTLDPPRPLFYNHLAACMNDVARYSNQLHLLYEKVYIVAPMFGSGLAGGDWNIVENLIEDAWVREGLNVTIYYLKHTLPSNWNPPSQ